MLERVMVIMPAFNAEATVAGAMDSVLKQTYSNWELLVIDDCSTDGTASVVKEYAAKDPRIHYMKNNSNLGVAASRNKGVLSADSSWIAFLDSDDMWAPEKLEKQMKQKEQYPDGVLFFTASGFMNADGARLDYVLHVPETVEREELLKQNIISCSSVLVRTDVMKNHLMPERQDIHEDFAAWITILSGLGCAIGLDEPMLIYRISDQSKSGNKLYSARMNWNTYRHVGMSVRKSIYYMCWYMCRGIQKYRSIA